MDESTSAARMLRVPGPDEVDAAIAALGAGEIVVVPTDTVYGVAAAPNVAGATAKLFAAKGRTDDVPVAVLCASTDQALALAADVSTAARGLAARHWPGALTLVLRRRSGLDWELGEPRRTIGVRCPDDAVIREICEAVGPIATTSANRHGQPTPETAAAAAASLLHPPAAVVDGGPRPGRASTVVDATGDELRILRQGEVALGPGDVDS